MRSVVHPSNPGADSHRRSVGHAIGPADGRGSKEIIREAHSREQDPLGRAGHQVARPPGPPHTWHHRPLRCRGQVRAARLGHPRAGRGWRPVDGAAPGTGRGSRGGGEDPLRHYRSRVPAPPRIHAPAVPAARAVLHGQGRAMASRRGHFSSIHPGRRAGAAAPAAVTAPRACSVDASPRRRANSTPRHPSKRWHVQGRTLELLLPARGPARVSTGRVLAHGAAAHGARRERVVWRRPPAPPSPG